MSGSTTAEYTAKRFQLSLEAGMRIAFVNNKDARAYHAKEAETFRDVLKAYAARLEPVVASDFVGKFRKVDWPVVSWDEQRSVTERNLEIYDYSPYGRAMVAARLAKEPRRDFDPRPERFVLLFRFPQVDAQGSTLDLRMVVEREPGTRALQQLREAIEHVVRPHQVATRKPSHREPPPSPVRSDHVSIDVTPANDQTLALARRIGARLDAEIAPVQQEQKAPLANAFRFRLSKGAVAMDVTLRTVERETEVVSPLLNRLLVLCESDLPGLQWERDVSPGTDVWILGLIARTASDED
jgi:hypothetical protein